MLARVGQVGNLLPIVNRPAAGPCESPWIDGAIPFVHADVGQVGNRRRHPIGETP
jgi:hypothetical protein